MDSGNWHGNRKILKAVKSLSKLFEENFNWHFAYPQLSVGWILSCVHTDSLTVVELKPSHWLGWSPDPGREPISAGDSGWSSCTCYILTQSSLECAGVHTFRSSNNKNELITHDTGQIQKQKSLKLFVQRRVSRKFMTILPPSVSSEQTADIPCQWMVSVVRVTIINGDVNSQQRWQKPGHGDTDTLVRPNLSRGIPNQTHKAVTFYSRRDLSEVLSVPGALLSPVTCPRCPYTGGARCRGPTTAPPSRWSLRAPPMWAKLR